MEAGTPGEGTLSVTGQDGVCLPEEDVGAGETVPSFLAAALTPERDTAGSEPFPLSTRTHVALYPAGGTLVSAAGARATAPGREAQISHLSTVAGAGWSRVTGSWSLGVLMARPFLWPPLISWAALGQKEASSHNPGTARTPVPCPRCWGCSPATDQGALVGPGRINAAREGETAAGPTLCRPPPPQPAARSSPAGPRVGGATAPLQLSRPWL